MRFELHHLRCFVAVASDLHFGRAAARLNMSQPPLSRQIRVLEEILGVELFVRTSRSVRLTSAGHVFLRETHRLLEQADTMALAARTAVQTDTGTLTVGLIGAATYDALPRLVREARRALPYIALTFREMLTSEQVEALALRRIDLGLGRLPAGARGLHTAVIARERLLLALPEEHPLAIAPALTLHSLGDHPCIGYEPQPSTLLYELLEHVFVAAEFTPNIVQRSRQTQTVLSLVSAGVGVALVPETARRACFPDVQFREIEVENRPMLEMHMLWRPDNDNPALPPFRKLLLGMQV